MVALDRAREIGHLVRVIGERVVARLLLKKNFRLVGRGVLQHDGVFDPQFERFALEGRDGDAVVEHVVYPAKPMRPRLNGETGAKEPLVVAVPGPQHHPVLAEPNRRVIGIGRDVSDR